MDKPELDRQLDTLARAVFDAKIKFMTTNPSSKQIKDDVRLRVGSIASDITRKGMNVRVNSAYYAMTKQMKDGMDTMISDLGLDLRKLHGQSSCQSAVHANMCEICVYLQNLTATAAKAIAPSFPQGRVLEKQYGSIFCTQDWNALLNLKYDFQRLQVHISVSRTLEGKFSRASLIDMEKLGTCPLVIVWDGSYVDLDLTGHKSV